MGTHLSFYTEMTRHEQALRVREHHFEVVDPGELGPCNQNILAGLLKHCHDAMRPYGTRITLKRHYFG
jgi:hypothetical protein